MQILASHLSRLAIKAYRDNQIVGYLGEPIVDPELLEVVAMHCRIEKSPYHTPVILMRDISEFDQDLVVIGSEDDVGDASEIVRVARLLAKPFHPLHKPVVTQAGHRLGLVEDYTVSPTNYCVLKLYVKRPLLASLTSGSSIIDRSQVVEVTPKRFVVRDATATAKAIVRPLAAPIIPE